jgi:hypothetical protein
LVSACGAEGRADALASLEFVGCLKRVLDVASAMGLHTSVFDADLGASGRPRLIGLLKLAAPVRSGAHRLALFTASEEGALDS